MPERRRIKLAPGVRAAAERGNVNAIAQMPIWRDIPAVVLMRQQQVFTVVIKE